MALITSATRKAGTLRDAAILLANRTFDASGRSGYNGAVLGGKFHQLGKIVDNILKSKIPGYANEPGTLSIQCNYNQQMNKHVDKINLGHSYIFAVGDYSDGELQVYDGEQAIDYDIRSKIWKFDGQTPHGVARIGPGVRISFVIYRHEVLQMKAATESKRL
eukprot:CAMPEP_0119263296 /NCGR_PEP_ID=MMETSP1329-20130426/2746_1 /TAXON_ID=114041 /ORGANISM="Genus nov. species nov., Strain RCC1024" /LENGTH=161 /DNA_ID=CAMNT_0007262997 /DNA_START=99 /DNA_END=581 /DNA_ORIENTATION=-